MDSIRTWGDGVGDIRPHVITYADMSAPPGDQWAHCGPCDIDVNDGEFLTLDRAWTRHRGLEYRLPDYGPLATDDEVADFLAKLEDPQAESTMAGSKHGSVVAAPDNDLTDAFALLDRLEALGERCTCAYTAREDCPNYIEGDEDD